jgi:hypothetical protein
MPIKWEDRYEQFDSLGESQLLHLARNESASVAFRAMAVEIMLKKGYSSVNHPELAGFLAELSPKIVIEELEHEPELDLGTEPITPISTHFEPESGPFKASVTTESLQKPEVVHFPDDQD